MITAQQLKESRDTLSEKYTEFNHLKVRCPNHFIVFYEGKDAPYFYGKIRQYTQMEISPIKCNGKSKVKGIYLSLKNKGALDDVKTGFFIDKDFDKNDEDFVLSDFYVTERYAIENYYVTDNCLKKIIKNELGISEGCDDFNIIMERYHSFQTSYHASIALFNAWYYTVKNNGRHCEVSLGEKLPKGYLAYDIENWKVSQAYNLETLNSNYANQCSVVTNADILASHQLLDGNPTYLYRGKYELSCLVCFMLEIQKELNRKTSEPGTLNRNPYKCQITNSQVLSLWAQYSEEDEKLKDYLQKRLTQHI